MLNPKMVGEDAIQEDLPRALPHSGVTAFEFARRENPGLAARIQSLQCQNKLLQKLGADVLDEPVPERLLSIIYGSEPAEEQPPAPSSPPRAIDGSRGVIGRRSVLLALVGIGIGWAAHMALTPL